MPYIRRAGLRHMDMKQRTLTVLLLVFAVLALASDCGDPGADPAYCEGNAQREAVWTPDGRTVIFPSHRNTYLYAVEPEGARLQRISVPPADGSFSDFSPSVSPDGSRVAFATFRLHSRLWFLGERSLEIATSALDGSDYRRLTDSEALDTNPAWSPDGTRIAFVSGMKRTTDWGIYTMTADGSDLRRITPASLVATKDLPMWSPDGRRLAFLVNDADATALYTVAADGSDPTRISAVWGRSSPHLCRITRVPAAWSPDGTRIAFVTGRQGHTARPDGSDVQELTYRNEPTFGTLEPYQAHNNLSWSPDGSEIRFVGVRHIPQQVDWRSTVHGVYAIAIDGSSARTIIEFTGPDSIKPHSLMAWSPDGGRIAVLDSADPRYPNVVLYTTAADGSDSRPLVWKQDRQYVNGEYQEERLLLSPPPTPPISASPTEAATEEKDRE